jgi:hypothetical protein
MFLQNPTRCGFCQTNNYLLLNDCTVTSRDINFHYPDWVTQTKFVPEAKSSMPCVPEFSMPLKFLGRVLENLLSFLCHWNF